MTTTTTRKYAVDDLVNVRSTTTASTTGPSSAPSPAKPTSGTTPGAAALTFPPTRSTW